MQEQWRNNANWAVLGAIRDNPPAPKLPERANVRVRALRRCDGSPSFCVNGEPVAPGSIVTIDADAAATLVQTGKAEPVHD